MDIVDQYINGILNNIIKAEQIKSSGVEDLKEESTGTLVDGILMQALLELHAVTGDDRYLDYVLSSMDRVVRDDGSLSGSGDCIVPGRVLYALYDRTDEKKFLDAVEALAEKFESWSGEVDGKQMYNHDSFPDRYEELYRNLPFSMEHDNRASLKEALSTKKNYVAICSRILELRHFLKHSDLVSENHATSSAVYPGPGWSMGCLLMALVDVLEVMDTQFYDEYRQILEMFQDMVHSVLELQSAEGLWYWNPGKPEKEGRVPELAGTAMISCSLMKAARLGFLHDRFWLSGRKGFDGLISKLFSGKDFLSPGGPVSGPLIMAYGEILRRSAENHDYNIPHIIRRDRLE